MFVPAAQRLAAEAGHGFHAGIMAFGGVDIEGLLEANLPVEPAIARGAAAWTIGTLIHEVELAGHLRHLDARFLVIRRDDDRQIPAALSARLAELTPEPRDVITLEAGHMHPRNRALTEGVVRLSQEWLVRHGVISAAGRARM